MLSRLFLLIVCLMVTGPQAHAQTIEDSTVVSVTAQPISLTSVRLDWPALTGASYYNVLLDGYKIAAFITDEKYVVENLTEDASYQFAIIACRADDACSHPSPKSALVTLDRDSLDIDEPDPPELTAPAPNSVLTGADVTFTWTPNTTEVLSWYLTVGDTEGTAEHVDESITDPATLSYAATLPTDGRELHVTLSHEQVSGVRVEQRYILTAHDNTTPPANVPEITSPAPGSTLTSRTVNFTWQTNGVAVEEWYLRIGTTASTQDLLNQRISDPATLSLDVGSLPNDGTPIYVRLFYKLNSVWQNEQFQYTSWDDPAPPAVSGDWGEMRTASIAGEIEANPLVYELSASSPPRSNVRRFGGVGCAGELIHITGIPNNRDVIVKMAAGTTSVDVPVWVTGGRNHVFFGLHIKPRIQANCDKGESTVRDPSNHPNVNPYVPGGIALKSTASGVTWVEGTHIDLDGIESDCVVLRNNVGSTHATKHIPKRDRDFFMINGRCDGYESTDASQGYGFDGIHGDLFQNQGTGIEFPEPVGLIQYENFVGLAASANGITHHHTSLGGRLRELNLYDFFFGPDPVHNANDAYDKSMYLAFTAQADGFNFDNVWINHSTGNHYGKLNGVNRGFTDRGGAVTQTPGMHKGDPPINFAPKEMLGDTYDSPYTGHNW